MKHQITTNQKVDITKYVKLSMLKKGNNWEFKLLKESIRHSPTRALAIIRDLNFTQCGVKAKITSEYYDMVKISRRNSVVATKHNNDAELCIVNARLNTMEIFTSQGTGQNYLRMEKAYSAGELSQQIWTMRNPSPL